MRTTLLVLALAVSGMPGSARAAKPSHPQVHKVKNGETAVRIARDNGLTVAELASLNPKLKLDRLAIGTSVRVVADKKTGKRADRKAEKKVEKQVEKQVFPEPQAQARSTDREFKPLFPLPTTPAIGPVNLVHLERVLPMVLASDPARPGGAPDLNAVIVPAPRMSAVRSVPPGPASAAGDVNAYDDIELSASPSAQSGLRFQPADPKHLDLLWPVETRTVSSAWGPRMRSKGVRVKSRKRKMRYRGSHRGVDLTAPMGTDVFAALEGVVVASGWHRQYGNFVAIDHGNGVVTLYAHHSLNISKEGEVVRRGQKIAEVGRTGNATGPHLHFELRLAGRPQNPLPYLNDEEEIPADLVAENSAAGVSLRRR